MQIKDGLVQGFRLFFMGGNIAAENLKTEEAGAKVGPAKTSYGQILKSSALIGGSSVINIVLGMVRTKVMAVLLGPGGVGLMGMYNSIIDTARTLSGMGMGTSGIRQIAEAVGTGEQVRIARTAKTLKHSVMVLGVLGAFLVILFRNPICRLTFGNQEHAGAIAILAVTVLLASVSNGQVALLQGVRRIGDLARLSVLGALLGTVLGIPIIYFWGEQGIVPLILTTSAMTVLTSWWYARKVRLSKVAMGFGDIRSEASAMLKLGIVFMATVLVANGVAYGTRVIIMRHLGVAMVGLYQAAWTMSTLYVDFILQAMGKDFYPRLTAVSKDNTACNRLVNEQAEVGLLLAAPGILGTLTFASLVLSLFYSAKFAPAVEILRWQILGMFLRVTSWPMVFILIAKGKGKLYFAMEVLAQSLHIGLIWLGIAWWVLRGVGMAFVVYNLFYWCVTFVVVRKLTGFAWSPANRRFAMAIAAPVLVAFLAPYFLIRVWAMVAGAAATLLIGLFSFKALHAITGSRNVLASLANVLGLGTKRM